MPVENRVVGLGLVLFVMPSGFIFDIFLYINKPVWCLILLVLYKMIYRFSSIVSPVVRGICGRLGLSVVPLPLDLWEGVG